MAKLIWDAGCWKMRRTELQIIRGVTRVARPPLGGGPRTLADVLILPPSVELLLPVIHDCQCPAGGRGQWLVVASRECQ